MGRFNTSLGSSCPADCGYFSPEGDLMILSSLSYLCQGNEHHELSNFQTTDSSEPFHLLCLPVQSIL